MFDSVSSIDKYIIGATIGRGSFGKVKEAFDSESLCRRAIKILKGEALSKTHKGKYNAKNEFNILNTCRHKNIIAVYDAMSDGETGDIYYVFEFGVCDVMSLMKASNCDGFYASQSHYYFKQILNGVEYLHSNKIVHKDLKPSNILLNQAEVIKIIDFGVSEKLDIFNNDGQCTVSNGSPAFQSPEVLGGVVPFNGYKLDSWGCGFILYYLSTGKIPFYAGNLYAMLRKIEEGDYTIPTVNEKVSEELVDLIQRIFTMDPDQRPNVSQIKLHKWVQTKPPYSPHVPLSCVAKPRNPAFDMTTTDKVKIAAAEISYRDKVRSKSDFSGSKELSAVNRKK